jgi:hypothetical protein
VKRPAAIRASATRVTRSLRGQRASTVTPKRTGTTAISASGSHSHGVVHLTAAATSAALPATSSSP